MRAKIFFAVLFLLCSVFAFPYEEVKHLSLPAAGIELLEIDCGAGFLEVVGIEGQDKIEVDAEIIIKGLSTSETKRYIENRVQLYLEKQGNRAVLVSKMKDSGSFSFGHVERVINLKVKVPKKIDLDVDDGSGSIDIKNIAGNLEIEDGSGSTDIANITGDVEIDDGSGSINIEDVRGNVDIDDGSGEIEVIEIKGEVTVDDGSGSISIRNADGDVEISDGSGSIYVNGVEKNVNVRRDGSGGITIKNVKGNVKIPSNKKDY